MSLADEWDPFSARNILINTHSSVVFDVESHEDDSVEIHTTGCFQLADISKETLPSLGTELLHISSEVTSSKCSDDLLTETSLSLSWSPQFKEQSETEQFDIQFVDLCEERVEQPVLLSWDQFDDRPVKLPLLFGDGDGAAYRTSLRAKHTADRGQQLIRPDVFLRELQSLLLGRSSILFSWSESGKTFELTKQDFVLSNYHSETTLGLCEQVIQAGTVFRSLQQRTRRVYKASPALQALNSFVQDCLRATEYHFEHANYKSRTLLELALVANKYKFFLSKLNRLLDVFDQGQTQRESLTNCMKQIASEFAVDAHLDSVLHYVSTRLLRAATLEISSQLEEASCSQQLEPNHEFLLEGVVPEATDAYVETLEYLQLLSRCGEHKQLNLSPLKDFVLPQSWSCAYTQLGEDCLDFSPQPESLILADRSCSEDVFNVDLSPTPRAETFETLQRAWIDLLDENNSGLEVDSIPHERGLLCPLQAAQLALPRILICYHQLLSQIVLRKLFEGSRLIYHLRFLQSCLLFSSCELASSLSLALFSSSQEGSYDRNGRRITSTSLSMGLRLEDRETWPPAAPELRLVLANILTETFARTTPEEALNCVSFAIRDLSDVEMEACRDVHSVHALDFLRLTYTTPDPLLQAILTPKILVKCDRVFKHMLLLLRIKAISQASLSQIREQTSSGRHDVWQYKYYLELSHFVNNFVSYTMDVVIAPIMQSYILQAVRTESKIGDTQMSGDVTYRSLADLRKGLDSALDQILNASLLKQKQEKAYQCVIELCSQALRPGKPHFKPFYERFVQQIHAFLNLLKAMTTKTSNSGSKQLIQLRLRLDLMNYYTADLEI